MTEISAVFPHQFSIFKTFSSINGDQPPFIFNKLVILMTINLLIVKRICDGWYHMWVHFRRVWMAVHNSKGCFLWSTEWHRCSSLSRFWLYIDGQRWNETISTWTAASASMMMMAQGDRSPPRTRTSPRWQMYCFRYGLKQLLLRWDLWLAGIICLSSSARKYCERIQFMVTDHYWMCCSSQRRNPES